MRAKPRRDGLVGGIAIVVAVVVVAFFAGTNVADESKPVAATGPVPTVLAPQAASELAEFKACEPLEDEIYKLLVELFENFDEHGGAHMKMRKNQISKAERDRVWGKTLGKLHHLGPEYEQLAEIWDKECGK